MVQSIPEMIHPQRVLTAEDLEGDLIQPGDPLMGIVWINRDRMSGTPCFSGTRVPIQHLFDHLTAGDTLDEFLTGFPGVSRDQVLAVIRLAGASLLHRYLPISVLVLIAESNRLADLLPLAPAVELALQRIAPKTVVEVRASPI